MWNTTDKFLIMGRSGCGKSHLGKIIQNAYPRKIVFDTSYEYPDSSDTVYSFNEFSERLIKIKESGSREFNIIIRLSLEGNAAQDEFDEILSVLFVYGSLLIVVEEVQDFCQPHSIPTWLRNCLLRGRHRDLALLFTTQRPGVCNKTLLSQANHIFCGSLHEKNDVDYARSILGEQAFELPMLPIRKFFYFRPGEKTLLVNNSLE